MSSSVFTPQVLGQASSASGTRDLKGDVLPASMEYLIYRCALRVCKGDRVGLADVSVRILRAWLCTKLLTAVVSCKPHRKRTVLQIRKLRHTDSAPPQVTFQKLYR